MMNSRKSIFWESLDKIFLETETITLVDCMVIATQWSDNCMFRCYDVQLMVQQTGFAAVFCIVDVIAVFVLYDQTTVTKVWTVCTFVPTQICDGGKLGWFYTLNEVLTLLCCRCDCCCSRRRSYENTVVRKG